MKKIILILLFITPLLAGAQNSKIGVLFDEFSGKDGYTSVHITKYMFSLLSKINTQKEEREFNEIVTKLRSIKVLSSKQTTDNTFGESLKKIFNEDQYKTLMTIKDSGETIHFYINEKNDVISELVMTVVGKSPVLIFLEGDINLKEISKLSKLMNIKELQLLENIKDKEAHE